MRSNRAAKLSIFYMKTNACHVEEKAGKESQPFIMDGKGVYMGESSRTMYECGKEHQRDKDDKSDDSHQIKHWLLDHTEIEEPPRFKFKIVSTFKDPLTRQLAESVRIERRGTSILNCKSEYSRCKVTRLRVDMEESKNKVKNDLPGVAEEVRSAVDGNNMTDRLDEERNMMEDTVRRQFAKRKVPRGWQSAQQTKPRTKLRLGSWGWQ